MSVSKPDAAGAAQACDLMAGRLRTEANDRHLAWSGDRARQIAGVERGHVLPTLEGLDTTLYMAAELEHAAALLRALLACSKPCQTEVKRKLTQLEQERKAAVTPQKPRFVGGKPT